MELVLPILARFTVFKTKSCLPLAVFLVLVISFAVLHLVFEMVFSIHLALAKWLERISAIFSEA